MNPLQTVLSLSVTINAILDLIAIIVFLAGLVFMLVRYTSKSINKDGFGKGLYMGIVATLEAGILIFIIYLFQQFLVLLLRNTAEVATVRWIILYLIAIVWSYRASYKASGWRGVLFVLIILTTLLFGWLFDHWIGIFAMSVPVLVICFYFIHRLAQVILPASDPEDKVETWKKTRVFLVYLLGVQHTFWLAAKTERKWDVKLDGSSNQIGKPGIIWTWSHQAAGISRGAGANRIAGPGLIFTEPYEAPIAVVDLRMQSRVCHVDTVTKDGLKVSTIVFTAFTIDKRDSPLISHTSSKRRLGNAGSINIDRMDGSFPYSSGRVLKALSTVGITKPRQDQIEDKQELLWDEWVVKRVEHVTQQAVAERSLDELWRPKNDDRGTSALNEIAAHLQDLLAPELTEVGINLITVRIVNYEIPKDDPIVQQNLNTWRSYWERKIAEANADIEMIYRDEIEKAHAYSKSLLLSAVADSIQRAHNIDAALPRHVIAQYFIHALDEYIKGQPGLNVDESKERLKAVKEILMNNRLEGNE